ncbi:DUF4347 domain-containing protein [Cuspidothrix issatschenkoi LEGE 03284]|nr:DUF4347 domain-containing protein [Cuspidothrix issatschenkoi LEGE 03284]
MLNKSLPNQTSTVVFIDTAVSDYQTLHTGVVQGVESVIISPNRDGIEQITEFFRHHT